jgi:4-alpha-glucanotransferase
VKYYIIVVMQYCDALINELSGLCGIVPEYRDIFGNKHIASIETKKAVLRAMRIDADSKEELMKYIHARKSRPWENFIEPAHVVSVNEQPVRIPIYVPVKESEENKIIISWSIEAEDADQKKSSLKTRYLSGDDSSIPEVRWIEDSRYVRTDLADDIQRPTGYYRITVECKHPAAIFPGKRKVIQKKSRLIITPDSCYMPEHLQRGRSWGLALNLYSVRSGRNWGIGDFTDLENIVRWSAGLKADCIGINPLHSITNTQPFGVSPYSPISRLFKNFVYLDIEKIPEAAESEEIKKHIASRKFQKGLNDACKSEFIDYEKTALLKSDVLRMAFDIFCEKHYGRNTKRGKDFRRYIAEEGTVLESYALFMVLREHMKKTGHGYNYQDWPEDYQIKSGKTVKAFRKKHEREIIFHQYLQWLIDGRLQDVAEEAGEFGMRIGLYNDLAVGSVGGGSDAWNYQDVVAGGADLGAPPDDFNINGQKWGFPPFIPEKLKETGYELFIRTIRKNMKYGGAIRIDHALGLFRLFWIPQGMHPKEGAYVECFAEDLIRIIALESVRHKTVVIAEDLGTISGNARETLQKFHMLSYRLFYFERNYPDPSFLEPEKYPVLALCAVTTHDLPTLYGYWAGRDIEVKKQLNIFADENQWRRQMRDRERDKGLILSALKSRGIFPADYPSDPAMIPEMTHELCLAIYQYLSETPCKLLLVSLDDIIGTLNQQNLPGTVDEHPNWKQKTPVFLEEILKDGKFNELSNMLKRYF